MSVRLAGGGDLVFRRHPETERTYAETCAARSPLKLLTPKNHGAYAWVFTASFGGGLVDGDSVSIGAHLHRGARALLGTQASTKIYRADRSSCRQTLSATIEDDASLVVLPDPVSPFAASRFAQRNEIHLGHGASLLLVDAYTCGRAAHGERWEMARYASTTRVFCVDQLVLHDAVLLDPSHGALAERMGRFEALATVSLIGPAFRPLIDPLLAGATPLSKRPDVLISVSPLPRRTDGDAAVVRLAAISVERLMIALRDVLRNLPEILGDDPFARKW